MGQAFGTTSHNDRHYHRKEIGAYQCFFVAVESEWEIKLVLFGVLKWILIRGYTVCQCLM